MECLLIDLLELLQDRTAEGRISFHLRREREVETFTYRSGDGEAVLL